ncbi:MAG TPA: ester cyclase [Terriglobales bacterium]|jgi:hypothetical protein|nr:ester cyclase [Terriglobales bacterium]
MQINSDLLADFAQRYTAAWSSGNPESVAAFFSVNGSLTINSGTPAIGRSEIMAVADSFMTTFPDLTVAMDDLRIEVGGAKYNWTLTGTHTGPGGTGRKIHISGFERWRIGEDGLIASSEGWFDAAEYQRQMTKEPARGTEE